jgi:hypothetical protein
MVSDESQSSATYQQPQFGRALHLAFASRTDLHTSVLESQPDAAPNHCEADARLTAQASESCPNVGRPVKQGGNHRQRVVEQCTRDGLTRSLVFGGDSVQNRGLRQAASSPAAVNGSGRDELENTNQ